MDRVMVPWALWACVAACALCSVFGLFCGIRKSLDARGGRVREEALRRLQAALIGIQTTLEVGLVPTEDDWERLSGNEKTWGELIRLGAAELRDQGAPLLPTLRRWRERLAESLELTASIRAKCAQAFAQAVLGFFAVPIMGCALYWLLPSIQGHLLLWFGLCLVCSTWAGVGSAWVLGMAEDCRYGGLQATERPWLWASELAVERFCTLLRCGQPPDLAWLQMHAYLMRTAPGLAAHWGAKLWSDGVTEASGREGLRQSLARAGAVFRRVIQVNVLDGKPCLEPVETAATALARDIRAQIEQNLALLPTRALQPLFLCTAPSAFGLLAAGILLAAWDAGVADL